MRYALITPQDTIDRMSSAVDPAVATKAGWRWLACPPVAPPSFDPTLELVEGPAYTVGASEVTEAWTKRNLTAQEIGERKDAVIAALNGGGFAPILKALLNLHNRVRVLEGQAQHTLAQFKTALKTLL